MTNCVCHDVPLRDCPTIRKSPALRDMVRKAEGKKPAKKR